MSHVMDTPISLAWWRKPAMRPLLYGGAALIFVGMVTVLFWGSRETSLRTPVANLTISTVAKDTFHDFVALQGQVVPKDTIDLDAQQGGQVAKLLVQAGDHVDAGQPMIIFRNDQL